MAVAAVVAVVEEEEVPGDLCADSGLGDCDRGVDRFRVGLQQTSGVQLTRRAALIPSLVATVGSFASHEKAVLTHIADAQTALTAATSGKSVTQRSSAEREFDTAVGQVLALGQAYPQLNSSNNFLNLQQNLADTEDKLAFARQYYNDSAATVNRLRTTIPWMFVAGLAGVSEREFYQVPR